MNTINQTLQYLIKAIVSEPDSVTIEEKVDGDQTIFEISAPKEMIGQIIGKEGKIIKSLRTILNLCYPNTRYNLEIKE